MDILRIEGRFFEQLAKPPVAGRGSTRIVIWVDLGFGKPFIDGEDLPKALIFFRRELGAKTTEDQAGSARGMGGGPSAPIYASDDPPNDNQNGSDYGEQIE